MEYEEGVYIRSILLTLC